MTEKHEGERTERTRTGYEVPVPTRGEFFANLGAASRPMLVRFEGGPAHGKTDEGDEPPADVRLWVEAPDLEPVPEGGQYAEGGETQHRYRLASYDADPMAPEPRAVYVWEGPEPS